MQTLNQIRQAMLWDWNQIEEFYSLFELSQEESLFLSLSARNKYLTDAERAEYQLGRTEMFARTVLPATDEESLDFYLNKMLVNLLYRRTKSGLSFPLKALVIYANIHPTSLVKAYTEFKRQMDKVEAECLSAALNNKTVPLQSYKKLERHLLTAHQKSRSGRLFTDIDLDSKDTSVLYSLYEQLERCDPHVIETRGGYHLLVRPSLMREHKINLGKIVDEAHTAHIESTVPKYLYYLSRCP